VQQVAWFPPQIKLDFNLLILRRNISEFTNALQLLDKPMHQLE
jgi:hypothetical protein